MQITEYTAKKFYYEKPKQARCFRAIKIMIEYIHLLYIVHFTFLNIHTILLANKLIFLEIYPPNLGGMGGFGTRRYPGKEPCDSSCGLPATFEHSFHLFGHMLHCTVLQRERKSQANDSPTPNPWSSTRSALHFNVFLFPQRNLRGS